MALKKKIEHLVIKERTDDLTFFNQFISGLRLFTETALLIGVGAVATLWERIGKILSSRMEGPVDGGSNVHISSPLLVAENPSGKVKVPLLPIDDYRQLGADQIIRKLKDFSHEKLELVRQFECSHKNRKSVVEAIDRFLSGAKS